jgi:large subunit ribosomal protein L22
MEITHRTRNIKIAPRKLRLVVDKVRHLPAEKAVEVLPLVIQKGALHVRKSLLSAIQAAKDQQLDPGTLVIQRAWCDEGTPLKRRHRFSRGQSAMMMKKYSHMSLVLKGEPAAKRPSRIKKAAQKETSQEQQAVSAPETNQSSEQE